MSRSLKLNLILLAITGFIIFVSSHFLSILKVKAQTTSTNLTGYAWSENIGWISFSGNVSNVSTPSAPSINSTLAGNEMVDVSFNAPNSNGGTPIIGYTVISNPAGGVDINNGSTNVKHTVTGLTGGTTYTFKVTATNAVGTGPASAASNPVVPLTSVTWSREMAPMTHQDATKTCAGLGSRLPTVSELTAGFLPWNDNNFRDSVFYWTNEERFGLFAWGADYVGDLSSATYYRTENVAIWSDFKTTPHSFRCVN